VTLLRTSPTNIVAMASPDSLIEQLLEQMLIRTGHRPSPAEQKSWGRSLPVLARDLIDAGLPGVEMLIEYHLPLTSQRADVVLAGTHPHTGEASYVVVELKQWSAARSYEGSAELVDVPGMPGGPKLHPVAQVQGYCSYLADFTRALADQPDALAGVAYLHNATDPAAVADLRRYPVSTTGRLFTGADRGDLLDFLRTRLAPDSGGHAEGDTLLHSAVAPSKQLLKVAADEVRDREQFRLLGNQQLAVDLVLHAVEQARGADTKRVSRRQWGAGQRQVRGGAVAAGRAGATRALGTAPHRLALVHPNAAQGRRGAGAASAEDVQVLQPVHGGGTQRARRPDPRRGTPHPRDLGGPLHQGGAAHGASADR